MNIFEIFGSIGLKDSGFKSGIADATEAGESFGSKVGGVFANVAKAAAVGLGAAATAFAGLATKALMTGGDLEQSLGGAEAVFGQFASSVEEVGAKAFETMGLSQSDFLATANKMGALMQGSGLSIEQSMDLSTQAMQRAADVASIMGIDINAAMESVAGAAKGNFTMMDNLGVAMNATTIESYALSKGIKTSYNEMNNAQKVGLAMEMFLEKTAYAAGNYAKENNTLAGSLNTTKAALSNFLSGAGDAGALVESVGNVVEVVSEKLQELLPRLTTGLTSVISQLIPLIPPLLQTMLPAIVEGASTLINGIVAALPALLGALVDAMPMVVKAILTVLPLLTKAAFDIVTTLSDGLVEMLPTLIPVAVDAVITLVETLIDNVDTLIDAAIAITMALAEGLVNALPRLMEKAPVIIAKLVGAIVENAPKLLNAAWEIILKLGEGLVYYLTRLPEYIGKVVDAIVNGIIALLPQVFNVGEKIVNELWGGIVSARDWLRNKVSGFFGEVVDLTTSQMSSGGYSAGQAFIEAVNRAVLSGGGGGISSGGGGGRSGVKGFWESGSGGTSGGGGGRSGKKLGEEYGKGVEEGLKASTPKAAKAAGKMSESIFDKAKRWIDQYRAEEDYMASEELAMWEELTGDYEKGTKERIEIDKNVKKLKEQILKEEKAAEEKATKEKEDRAKKEFESSKKWIETRKFFGLLTLSEEAEAWERVQSRYLEGTAEREEADKALFTVQQQIAKDREQIAKIQEEYSQKMIDAEKKYQDELERTAKSIANAYGGVFGQVKDLSTKSGTELMQDMRGQEQAMSDYLNALGGLAARGVSQAFYDEVASKGPGALGEIKALLTLSPEQLRAYEVSWENVGKLAREAAVKQLKPMREDTDKEIKELLEEQETKVVPLAEKIGVQTAKSIADGITSEGYRISDAIFREFPDTAIGTPSLKVNYDSDMSGIDGNMAETMSNAGNESGKSAVSAIGTSIVKNAKSLAEPLLTLVKTMREAIVTNFPLISSAIVEMMTLIALTIDKNKPLVIDQLTDLIRRIVWLFDSYHNSFVSIGENIMRGIGFGITSMSGWLNNLIDGYISDMIARVEERLDINSPSGVGKGIGRFFAKGIGIGFVDEMENVNRDIVSSIPTEINTGMSSILGGFETSFSAAAASGTKALSAEDAVRIIGDTMYDNFALLGDQLSGFADTMFNAIPRSTQLNIDSAVVGEALIWGVEDAAIRNGRMGLPKREDIEAIVRSVMSQPKPQPA